MKKHYKQQQSLRVWLAAGAHEKGSITLDCPLENFFRERKESVSILGVGVKKLSGSFQEGDAIGLFSEKGYQIGRGVAKISSDKMQKILDSGDTRGVIFVHVDGLLLFSWSTLCPVKEN